MNPFEERARLRALIDQFEQLDNMALVDAFFERTHHLRLELCPVCGDEHDCASSSPINEEHSGPKPGNVTICIDCLSLLMFTDDMTKRVVTEDEQRAWTADVQAFFRAHVRAIGRLKQARKRADKKRGRLQ